jgi:hypothetical protein
MRNPVVSAAFGLFFFYWTLLFFAYWYQNGWILPPGWWEPSVHRLQLAVVGFFCGAICMATLLWCKRKFALLELTGDEERGVTCTIGPLPKPPPPDRAKEPVVLANLRLPKDTMHWFEAWEKSLLSLEYEGEKVAEPHVRLAHALIQVLGNTPTVPAFAPRKYKPLKQAVAAPDLLALARRRASNPAEPAPPSLGAAHEQVVNRHGEFTLLEHSYSVAYEALELSKTWSFKDARDQLFRRKSKPRLRVKKVDPNYEWDSEDALVALLCLAHDLGKIKTFEQDEAGVFWDNGQDHDFWSQVLLARIPEFWLLPKLDRQALLSAVSCYHRPHKFTRHYPGFGIEDRAFTLQHLLIKADRRAGRRVAEELEAQEEEAAPDDEDDNGDVAQNKPDWQPTIWREFFDLLSEPGRIAASHGPARIGLKHMLDGAPVLFLHAWSVQDLLNKRLSMEIKASLGTSLHNLRPILSTLLDTLEAEGILVKTCGQHSAPADKAIWRMCMYGRDPNRHTPLAVWEMALLINPAKHFPGIAYGPDADSIQEVLGPADESKVTGKPTGPPPKTDRPIKLLMGADSEGSPDDPEDHADTQAVDPRIAAVRSKRKAVIAGTAAKSAVATESQAAVTAPSTLSPAIQVMSMVLDALRTGTVSSSVDESQTYCVPVTRLLGCGRAAIVAGLTNTETLRAIKDGHAPGVSVIAGSEGLSFRLVPSELEAAIQAGMR